jgi:dihydrofolate reductase
MGRIVLSQNMTLDGVMQSPGPTDVPFKYRGWAVDYATSARGAGFRQEETQLEQAMSYEAVLLGRVTFEAMAAFWPTADGKLADRLRELPKFIVSSTLTNACWNATVVSRDWQHRVTQLRAELDGDIVVYGSRRLSQSLIALGLADEIRLMVYPLAFGEGERLFDELRDRVDFDLVEARPLGGGVLSVTYAATRAR